MICVRSIPSFPRTEDPKIREGFRYSPLIRFIKEESSTLLSPAHDTAVMYVNIEARCAGTPLYRISRAVKVVRSLSGSTTGIMLSQDYLYYNVDDAPRRNLYFHNITSIFRGSACKGRLHWGKSGALPAATAYTPPVTAAAAAPNDLLPLSSSRRSAPPGTLRDLLLSLTTALNAPLPAQQASRRTFRLRSSMRRTTTPSRRSEGRRSTARAGAASGEQRPPCNHLVPVRIILGSLCA